MRIIFPFTPGGSGDALARHIAEGLRTALNQAVIVENRTGAQGRLGVQAVKSAAPDGKTILLTPVAPMSVYRHVYKALLYDPVADFEPVSQVAAFDFAIAVAPGADCVPQGAGRVGEGQSRAGQLRHARGRHAAAFFCGLVCQVGGPRSAPRRLSRLGRSAHGSGRRANFHRRHHHQRSTGAAQGRPYQGARYVRHGSLAVPA
ncbi:MAG: hypothetical protein HC869_26815 [Rhodospirillales bacterium]|nr:hypothetical protein [Rhodospirillales bacterium]